MPTKSEPVYFWLCADCDFSVIGSAEEAGKHFGQKGCWGHYMYEFVLEKDRPLPFSATGSEIHTSDSLVADYYLSPRSEDVDYVYKTFFKRKYNAAVEKLFAKPVAANSDS